MRVERAELPPDWSTRTIGDCCDILDSRRVPVNEDARFFRKGAVPYYGANGQQAWIDDFLFDEDLVLIAEDGGLFDEYATRPIAYRIKGKSWVNNHAHILRAKTETSNAWVFYNLVHEDIRHFISGGTRAKLTQSELQRIEVPFPEKPEQSRIAAVLDMVDEAVAKTEAVIAKLRQVRAGLLHDLLTRGLDPQGQLRDPITHPEQFQDSPLGRIPKEWNYRTLPTFATWQNGRPFPSSQYRDHGIRLLRPGNLPVTEFVSWGNLETCLPESWGESASDYLVHSGELVMNLTAQSLEEGFLGRVCMTRQDEHCLLNQRLARFRAIDVHLQFLFWCLRGPHFRKQMDRIPQGTKVQHLYNRDLERVLIAVPRSLDEQTVIAETLFSAAEHIESEVRETDKLCLLKSGLMTDLLTGRVRVPSAD